MLTATDRHQIVQKFPALVYVLARYYAAFILLGYGFAKVMGAQFTVLDSELAKPMGDVSGFWLTWYYFGYSTVYSSIVAWAQIIGAALLGFRQTALVGAILLLPVMVNIVCIDLWVVRFPLESGALRNAFFVLFALLLTLSFHVGDIYRFLRQKRSDLALLENQRLWTGVGSALCVLGMIAYTAHEGYWLANVNNRDPTSIDGAWELQGPHNADVPAWIYFEYNRANMAVFRFADGSSETHDFRVDDTSQTINIGQDWLTPGTDILKGTWSRSGDIMTLTGNWKGIVPVRLLFKRKPMKIKDHR